MNTDELFRGLGVEIALKTEDDFLKVKETLTRIGVASKKENILYQSCNILHKKGRYVIIHFKELFILDGKSSNLSENDLSRRNAIVKLLKDWDLIEILDESIINNPAPCPISQLKIISFKEKSSWILESKYSIGKKFIK